MVQLDYGNHSSYGICGGSVINTRTGVRLGDYDKNGVMCDYGTESCTHYQQFGIEKVIVHREFTASALGASNDIALIRLDRPIQFGHKMKPICLPCGTNIILEPPVHSVLTTTGWDHKNKFATKRSASVDCWDTDRCNEVFRVDETHICARGPGYSCYGDAGSPLIYKFDQRMVLVSFGARDCSNTKYPSVSTRVRNYGDWLSQNMEM